MVTRPESQSTILAELLKQAGAEPYLFPALAITHSSNPERANQAIGRLPGYDILIFISPNAVEYGINRVEQQLEHIPEKLLLATVGAGSARALEARIGRAPDIVPQDVFNSEALLAQPALQDMAGKQVMIMRGNGGRDKLATTLKQRGASVQYVEVYQRIMPVADAARLQSDWQQQAMDYVVVTSGEGLQNLIKLVGKELEQALLATPLVVVNSRLQSLAKQLGFSDEIITSDKASDAAIVEAIVSHHVK